MTSSYPMEVEVKFILRDPEQTRKRIIHIGANRQDNVFEYNLRLEDANQSLIQKKSLLRLRKDTETRLTFKSPPDVSDDQFKVFKELEVTVSDFDIMLNILKSLGYHPVQTYEKRRETFELPHASICIDELPFGYFLEIEGKKESIKEIAEKLGLAWEKRILANYLEIFKMIRQKLSLAFSDVTFDNFKGIKVDMMSYANLIEAGTGNR